MKKRVNLMKDTNIDRKQEKETDREKWVMDSGWGKFQLLFQERKICCLKVNFIVIYYEMKRTRPLGGIQTAE